MNRIILIEDDESFGYILSEYLALNDYQVDWAKTGEQGIEKINQNVYDLGIFDIMLPGKNGFEVAAIIKDKNPELPFVFLSAKALKIDKLKGFKLGADDYITKPVDEELLLAKIKVLIKRGNNNADTLTVYNIGNYSFKPSLQTLTFDQTEIELTKRESDLLLLLCNHQNKLLSRNKALKQIWGSTDEFSRKSMDVFISHLRKYLSKDAKIQIKNVHGQGFIFSIS